MVLSFLAIFALVVYATNLLRKDLKSQSDFREKVSRQGEEIIDKLSERKSITIPSQTLEKVFEEEYNTILSFKIERSCFSSLEYFLDLLLREGVAIEIVDAEDKGSAQFSLSTAIFKCQMNEVVFFIETNYNLETLDTSVRYFTLKSTDINLYSEKDGIKCINRITIVLPIKYCNEFCRTDIFNVIEKALEISKIVKMNKPSLEEEVKHYILIRDQNGLALTESTFNTFQTNEELLNYSYNVKRLIYDGFDYGPQPMKVTFEVLLKIIEARKNVVILGGTGTGKTALLDEVIKTFSNKPDYIVITMDCSTLGLLANPDNKKEFIQLIKNIDRRAIVTVDEAQGTLDTIPMDTLLTLLDGQDNRSMDINFVMSFNKEYSEMVTLQKGAFMREGRIKLTLELGLIPKHQAETLVKLINNSSLYFDSDKFNSFGEYMTLAQFWSCFSSKDLQSWIKANIATIPQVL